MSLSSGNASVSQAKWLTYRSYKWNLIFRILKILLKFLTARIELPDVKLEGFIKCNGVITPKMKLHGSKRIF